MGDRDTRRDEDLLAASGVRAVSFIAFYDRTMPGLLDSFARRALDGQVAADLTAETPADAFASRRRFRDRGDGSASAWLYTIAYRKLGRFIKRRRGHGAVRDRPRCTRQRVKAGGVAAPAAALRTPPGAP